MNWSNLVNKGIYYKRFKKKKKRKDKPTKIKKKKIIGVRSIKDLARKLQLDPPKSDRWFQSLWIQFKDDQDQYNEYFHGFIPDCINHKYRYVIEVDGSIHKLKEQKEKDKIKNKFYSSKGYYVYRIKAYKLHSFYSIKEKVLTRRKNYVKLVKNESSV